MEEGSQERFGFGENWKRFLSVLNEDRIGEAEKSLREMLGCDHLKGKHFIDIGSGSGLFSLAARRLGATVFSFDYDPQSVRCTEELRHRYFPDDPEWQITQGSVLDRSFMESLGKGDIVYSWGVLHHTGSLWQALDAAHIPVRQGGLFFIAIYNDQGYRSRMWRKVKRFYCSGSFGRTAVTACFVPYFILAGFCIDVLRLRNPLERYTAYKKSRGMSIVYDWFDWLGGYPFEVAAPEAVFDFYRQRGFSLVKLTTTNGWGNNEFVFRKED